MNSGGLAKVIDLLGFVRRRPHMYVQPCDVAHFVTWLNGVGIYEDLCGDEIDRRQWLEWRKQSIEARGWAEAACGCWVEMQERGLSPAAIIDELLVIETAVLQAAQSALAVRSIQAS